MRAVGHAPSYMELFARIEPRPIKTEEEADRIRREIDALLDVEELCEDEWEFLALLGDILSAWESHRIPAANVPVADKIRALLESHGLRQKDLVGSVFATESVVSDVVRGRRRLSYEHVEKLAEFFHVSPAVFYPSDERPRRGHGSSHQGEVVRDVVQPSALTGSTRTRAHSRIER